MCLTVAFGQRSEGGLYVDMCSFLGFGKDFVRWNFEKTGNPVYLHIQQQRKPVPEDRPLKKPTLLAIGNNLLSFISLKFGKSWNFVNICSKFNIVWLIGVEGGFDNQDPEYETTYNIVILPDFISLPFPSVELPEKVA